MTGFCQIPTTEKIKGLGSYYNQLWIWTARNIYVLTELEKYLEMTAKIVAKIKRGTIPISSTTAGSGLSPSHLMNESHAAGTANLSPTYSGSSTLSATSGTSSYPLAEAGSASPFSKTASLLSSSHSLSLINLTLPPSSTFTSSFLFSTLPPAMTPPTLTERVFPTSDSQEEFVEVISVITGNSLSRAGSTVVWNVDSAGGIHKWNVR